ncbi:MAG: hypothetical protein OXF98_01820, partial [Rhodospirillaceae bacterium]|nr:hypothetical protein [Rhodospirillaceae bacterium]
QAAAAEVGQAVLPARGPGQQTLSSGSFTPSKSNLYDAVKAIFHPSTNAGVTADDTDRELDIAAGSGGTKATTTDADTVGQTGTALSTSLTSRSTLDDAKFMTLRMVMRVLQRVLKTASTTLRGVVLLARNADVDATETDPSRVLQVTTAKRLIERLAPAARLLPAFPAAGSRNNKVPKFDGDTLEWQEDLASAAGGSNPAGDPLGDAVVATAATNFGTVGGITYAELPELFLLQIDGVSSDTVTTTGRYSLHLVRKSEVNETGGVVLQYSAEADGHVKLFVDAGNIGWEVDIFQGTLQLYSLKVPAAFDLHDDVATELTAPADADRLLASDESESGDPNRWLSLTRLFTYIQGKLGLPAPSSSNNGKVIGITTNGYSAVDQASGGGSNDVPWSAKAWTRGDIVHRGVPKKFYIRLTSGTDGASDSPDAGNAAWQLISGVETFVGTWAANRNYKKGQVVDRQSKFYRRKADGRDLATEPPETNSADWEEQGGGGGSGLEAADVVTLGRLQ